ncbi:MAG: dinuclear metal center YbgI/SA1388 family protein [Saprospiraceae bacterium]|jgi:dinuclear metal center YbgI/SA1388 family protein
MKIKDVTNFLETIAPSAYQESYDNAGLIVGDADTEVTGVLCCLDSTEAIVQEAIDTGCNLIVAHHPIVFKGLKRFNGKNYVERTIISAIKNDIAIYAIHTNLDNVYYQGVNTKIAEKLGLQNTRILSPKSGFKKLYTFVPTTHSEIVRQALFTAGAGSANGINNISYATLGVGTISEGNGAQMKLEVVFPALIQGKVLNALEKSHPAKNYVYDIISIENKNSEVGSGMIGELEKEVKVEDFLKFLKKTMKAGVVKYTAPTGKKIRTVAVCGGSGGFLLGQAIAQKADIFITADYKYHEFFDADGRIIIADIGHYESEQYTIELLHDIISKKFVNFAAHLTKVNTNPVNYL